MIRVFNATGADELYGQIVQAARSGEFRRQPSRSGITHEILHAGMSLADPRQRWIVSRRPAMNPAFALAEVVWILTGRNDSSFVTFFNSKLPELAGNGPIYHGAYGHRLRSSLGFDQLQRACAALRGKPESRQVVLQIWNGTLDMPKPDGGEVSPDVPCNVLSMLKIRDGCLEWTQVIRSNDVFKGLPHNLIQFTCLQEVMAGWLGVRLGSYNQVSDSLHIYDEEFAKVISSVSSNEAPNTDDLALDQTTSEAVFAEIGRRVDRLISDGLSPASLNSMVRLDGHRPYENILRVLCAEGARRRKWPEMADSIMTECTNPAFRVLWANWTERLARLTV